MDLESLLNASLGLEKRIATDRALRKYFSTIWAESDPKQAGQKSAGPGQAVGPGSVRELSLQFPAEMCELLELAANATGKTPSEILEECFVEHYLKKLNS